MPRRKTHLNNPRKESSSSEASAAGHQKQLLVVVVFAVVLLMNMTLYTNKFLDAERSVRRFQEAVGYYTTTTTTTVATTTTTTEVAPTSATGTDKDDEAAEAERLKTAIIILSNLVPSHPSTRILEKTIESFSVLKGLPPKTPIYISVDGLVKEPTRKTQELKVKDVIDDVKRLDQYTENLYKLFSGTENSHVTVVVSPKNQHINGSIRKIVHSLIDSTKTKYIYVLQHDLRFIPENNKTIDHQALVAAFDEHGPSNALRRVGFSQHKNRHYHKGGCPAWQEQFNHTNPWLINPSAPEADRIHLHMTSAWTDNNHFTTVDYYKELLDKIGPVPRPPEGPLQVSARIACAEWGSHFYGTMYDGQYICHLDGREASHGGYNNCPLEPEEEVEETIVATTNTTRRARRRRLGLGR